jgi:putative transposase
MTPDYGSRLAEVLEELFTRKDGPQRLMEALVKAGMEEEVCAYLGAGPYERTDGRRGYRAGYKPRTLRTRVGRLDLQVPQVRGCDPYHPSMFARWQRSERALLTACAEMYFQGVSTRRVRAVMEEMCDFELSAGTVSRIAAELDEKLEEFRARRLEHSCYPYLIIDARYEKVRKQHRIVGMAVLIVAGVTHDGRREILDWSVDDSESEDTWRTVLQRLKARGVTGVELVVSDAHKGIKAAVAREFQGACWQRCHTHYMRETLKKVSYKRHKELVHDLRYLFGGATLEECSLRRDEIAQKWEAAGQPRLGTHLRESAHECLAVLALPETHRRRMRSTNMLERVMKELKRRTRVVGIFPNQASCNRLAGAVLIELHEQWQLEEWPYVNMKLCD